MTEQMNVTEKRNNKSKRKQLATIKGSSAQLWHNAIQSGQGIVTTEFEENSKGVITHVNIYLED